MIRVFLFRMGCSDQQNEMHLNSVAHHFTTVDRALSEHRYVTSSLRCIRGELRMHVRRSTIVLGKSGPVNSNIGGFGSETVEIHAFPGKANLPSGKFAQKPWEFIHFLEKQTYHQVSLLLHFLEKQTYHQVSLLRNRGNPCISWKSKLTIR